VCEWPEPYDSTLYSLQTDNNYAMVTGTAQHGMVRLWDKRNTEPVQVKHTLVILFYTNQLRGKRMAYHLTH